MLLSFVGDWAYTVLIVSLGVVAGATLLGLACHLLLKFVERREVVDDAG